MKGHKTKLEIKDSYLIIALSVSIFNELDVPTLDSVPFVLVYHHHHMSYLSA